MSENQIMNEENFEEMLEASFKKIHSGEKVKGTIVKVSDTEAIVDLQIKHTGYVKLEELTSDPSLKASDVVKEGDVVDFIVLKVSDQEGTVMLSKKKVDERAGFEKILKAYNEGTIIEGTVQRVVKGGIIVNCGGVNVFVPASHIGISRDENPETLLKKKVLLKLIEAKENQNKAVGSIKAVKKAAKEEAQKKFWETAEVGAVYTGAVKSITSYGAFVDLGGIDGMVHISELSWKRIKHPTDVVKIGDTLEVYIKELDKENNRISLGYKKDSENPWEKFKAQYGVGDTAKVKIVSITPFGAFAQIIDGVDGLIHISQIADKRVENVKDVLSVGDEVDVKITEIDADKKRISLSIRALLEDNAPEETEDAE